MIQLGKKMRMMVGVAACALSVYVPYAQAKVVLGAEIRQTYRNVYVKTLDTQGVAAAAGLYNGDYIYAFNGQPIWYLGQLRSVLDAQDKNKSFTLLVKRKGFMREITVDPTKKNEVFNRAKPTKSGDEYTDCYIDPTVECIKKLAVDKDVSRETVKKKFSHYSSVVHYFDNVGRRDLAKPYAQKMKDLYYQLPTSTIFYLDFGSLTKALSLVGEKPDMGMIAFALERSKNSRGEKDASRYFNIAEYLVRDGFMNEGRDVVKKVMAEADANPKFLRYAESSLGKLIAMTKQTYLVDKFLKSSHYEARWKQRFLEYVATHYLKEENVSEASAVLDRAMVLLQQSSADVNYIAPFAQLYYTVYNPTAANKVISILLNRFNRASSYSKARVGYHVVRAYGHIGAVDQGRAFIRKNMENVLEHKSRALIELTRASAKSAGVSAWAIQRYKTLPALIEESYATLKTYQKVTGKPTPGYLLESYIEELYGLLATVKRSQFTLAAYDNTKITKDGYDDIVKNLIEVGQYPLALAWVGKMQKRFPGATANLALYSVFEGYGLFADGKNDSEIKNNWYFGANKKFFYRGRLNRLFWSGDFEQAQSVLTSLSYKDKRDISLLGQALFARKTCHSCDI